MPLRIDEIRAAFPALAIEDEAGPRAYLDGPAGTQVPRQVIARMRDYLIEHNANKGGAFATARQTDAVLADAHAAMADFLNAASPAEIIFGPNMTTLTYQISRSLGQRFQPGDAIVVTRMDHDANVWPWVQLAEERGLDIRWLSFDTATYEYHLSDLDYLLGDGRVRLVAAAWASNALGTINDVAEIARRAREAGALSFIDAVQYAPHGPIDVQAVGCDLLACSVYKFFGPHQGVLWGREELLSELPAYQVRPPGETLPGKFETGTQNHEGQAGTIGALEYLAWVGAAMGDASAEGVAGLEGRRRDLRAAMLAIQTYEQRLTAHLVFGLKEIPGARVHGISDPDGFRRRVPTVAFTLAGHSPEKVARTLARENIFVWSGHYYAVEVVKHLGLEQSGGMVRVGPVHYNTKAEIDRLLNVVNRM